MKQFQIILGLILLASVTTFAQSPRIKLNQITKDTVKGSVLISNPTDSGMVYSRDFYIAYGADTVLILYGDTLAATSGIISSVLSDGVTITGDGTTGNELKVDTSTVISTIQGLVDSLANYVTTNTTQTISGAKTFTNTFTQSGGDANFDSGTLYVDESENKVGIGTTSPGFKLTVEDTVPGQSTLRLNNTNSGGALYITKGATAIMFNGSADTWTSGGTSNDAALGAYQSNLKFFTNNSITLKARLDASGNWDILGTTGSLSDIRSKKNIRYLNSSLQNILLLKPVFYTSIFDIQEKEKIGFIAQDVQEIYPELVNNYGAENLLSLNYTGLIPVLTKAIQEQQTIIETQQTEIDQLKTLITDLINRLIILENK